LTSWYEPKGAGDEPAPNGFRRAMVAVFVAIALAVALLLLGWSDPALAGNNTATCDPLGGNWTFSISSNIALGSCMSSNHAESLTVEIDCVSGCSSGSAFSVVGLRFSRTGNNGTWLTLPPSRSVGPTLGTNEDGGASGSKAVWLGQWDSLDGIGAYTFRPSLAVTDNEGGGSSSITIRVQVFVGCVSSADCLGGSVNIAAASPLSVSGTVTANAGTGTFSTHDGSPASTPVTGPLTDAQLRATPVPVSGGGGGGGTVGLDQTTPGANTVSLSGGDQNRLDLVWWGVWFAPGLALGFWIGGRAWRHFKGWA
jgi:hypothetical protein